MDWNEAKITINGQELRLAESMTVRCAVTSFLSDISKNGLGNNETGKAIAEGYIRHSTEVLKKIGVITNEKKTENTRIPQNFEIDEHVVVQGWGSTATGTVKDIQWSYHNRLNEYSWHYLIGFDEGQHNHIVDKDLLIECIKVSPYVYEKMNYKTELRMDVLNCYINTAKPINKNYQMYIPEYIKDAARKENIDVDKYIFNAYMKEKLPPLQKVKQPKI